MWKLYTLTNGRAKKCLSLSSCVLAEKRALALVDPSIHIAQVFIHILSKTIVKNN